MNHTANKMRESLSSLNAKLQTLAQHWGETYAMGGAIVLREGQLTLKKRDKRWLFLWTHKQDKPIPLTSASVEVRLDATHALVDLLREVTQEQLRRVGDLHEAHEVLDRLLQGEV
jgi:hypothetical protein